MRKTQVNKLRDIIIKECRDRNITFSKIYFRRAKLQFNMIPRTMREDFTVADLK